MGPAFVWLAPFGTAEPTDSQVTSAPTVGSASWADVGGIADGTSVLLEVDLTYTDQGVDQLIDPIGARLTKRMVQVTAALAEATLQNLLNAQNQLGTITVNSGNSTYDPLTTSSATQPTYTSIIIDGWAPTLSTGVAARRRMIVRKCLSASKIALEYEKSKEAIYNTTWTGYYVSSSIPLYHIVDQTA